MNALREKHNYNMNWIIEQYEDGISTEREMKKKLKFEIKRYKVDISRHNYFKHHDKKVKGAILLQRTYRKRLEFKKIKDLENMLSEIELEEAIVELTEAEKAELNRISGTDNKLKWLYAKEKHMHKRLKTS